MNRQYQINEDDYAKQSADAKSIQGYRDLDVFIRGGGRF